ncbi:MAG: aminotransferase class III-fold pyridoxal phosphate-dependent enzyme [Candidatus Saganbacteria bacterium]|nr:aminotransferase class III-fold pyridoxal phosphate-dependent enzyme [Candidatus Saganbacteria bacterium]
MGKGQELYKRAKQIIPGGTQLLSKRPEMFLPDLWPAYYDKAKGCEVWDLDGNKYIDMSYMGVGSCILGYADPDVNAAVEKAVKNGSMCTLNAPEEVELADLLLNLHPWAEMVRYARTGGESMSIAVRIARAATKKDMILFSGYHGWHDWYLSSNLADDKSLDGHLLPGLSPNGVPRGLSGTAKPFIYNDTDGFLSLIEKFRGKIAAVVVETIRSDDPKPEFLETIRKVTKENGIVMIVDEVSSGWRLNVGGAHLLFGIAPDIAVFAKGISNGFPMAAIIGIKNIMQTAQDSFISSTYWTDRIGPAAALATIRKMKIHDVPDHLITAGKKVKAGWQALSLKHDLDVKVSGMDPIGHFDFNYKDPLILKTLFTQLMLGKGILATTAFYASYAHKDKHVKYYLNSADEAFGFIKKAILEGNPQKYLKGPICHSGFKRLT